jgi:hypothetical protein
MAPAKGVVAHQAVVQVAATMEIHHQAKLTGKLHLIQAQARQAAHARKVV